MKKICTLILLLLTIQQCSIAQNKQKTDSLISVLATLKEDTSKVNTLLAICKEKKNIGEFEDARNYADKALMLSEKIKFKMGIAKSYNQIGSIYFMQSDFSNSITFYKKALTVNEQLDYKAGIAKNFSSIGLCYQYLSDYPTALEFFQKSLITYESIGEKNDIAGPLHNIGLVYDGMLNEKQALYYYLKAKEINRKSGNKSWLCRNLEAIGNIYNGAGNYPEALKNYEEALKISDEIGDIHMSNSEKFNMGVVYSSQGNYSEALKNFSATLKYSEEMNEKDGLAISYIDIGDVYQKQGKLNAAKEFETKGLLAALDIGAKEYIKLAYLKLAVVDSAMNNFKGAYENHKFYKQYNDSIFNMEKDKKITQLQMNYDFEKKQDSTKALQDKKDAVAQKELQKQKLVRNGFIGGFAVVLLFAGVFFTQRNRIKKGKMRSDELLLNILPEEVAEELKAKGSADAKQFDDVTVMFTDFKNFTQISEKLSPTELVNEIHTCFKAFDDIIDKHNIEKIKTIGDSYMCAGGLPVANKTNAEDIVKAALEIQAFMNTQRDTDIMSNGQVSPSGRFRGAVRIGIHTGPVVAGIVGVKKFAYDIWGDTVNIASRMESSGEAGKVNISGSTYELVKDKFNCIHRGKIEAKNKGMIDMYFVNP